MMEGAHNQRHPSLHAMVARLTTQVTKLVKALQNCGRCQCTTSSSVNKTPGATASTPGPATGSVKWYNMSDQYGFIVPSDGGPDVFIHVSNIAAANPHHSYPSLAEGEPVSFIRKLGRRGPWAASVTGPDGQTVQGSPYAQLPDRPAQASIQTLQVQDDALPLPPAPEFDRPLPSQLTPDAKVATTTLTPTDHQPSSAPAPPSTPSAPVDCHKATTEDPKFFQDYLSLQPPRGYLVHTDNSDKLIFAHPNTDQSIVVEVVERVPKVKGERAMRTNFWEKALGENCSRKETGSELLEQGPLSEHQFPEYGEKAQWCRGRVGVKSVEIGHQKPVKSLEAQMEVFIAMVLYRLPWCSGDILITFNNPPQDRARIYLKGEILPWLEDEFWDFATSCRLPVDESERGEFMKAVFLARHGFPPNLEVYQTKLNYA